jgi:Zn-dependent M28 family amino/carboxypeptidase
MYNFKFKGAVTCALILQLFSAYLSAQDRTALFDESKMRDRVIRLSSDEFEGRGPGTDGARKAVKYIADQMKVSGILPVKGRGYFQYVKLVGVKADPNTVLHALANGNERTWKFGDDFVATTGTQKPGVSVDSELVFVGYGIDAPQYDWNDYKGDKKDYRGKVLLMLVNDPPATASEPNLFGGRALTYFGRWTYKYEEAARRGAAGVILVHTTDSAGYGWNVVRSSNGGWRYEIARTRSDKTPFLQFRSWMTNEAAEKMMKEANFDLDKLRRQAASRDFRPVSTGIRIRLDLNSETKTFDAPNVIGMIPGTAKRLQKEYVVFSGHWDHLGIGEPDAKGDRIYNGAYDNASGIAAILGIGDAVMRMPESERPKRSLLFLFPTAEEQGLLGAEYYSKHPLVPLEKTVADINIDGVNFFGKVSNFMPLGAERSSMLSFINEAAIERRMTVDSDRRPEQGFFFRSDHFPFAKVGIPSINLQHGDKFITPLKDEAANFFRDYTAKYYHQVSDEYKDWWDTSAMVQEAELALAIGMKLANSNETPHFKDSDEFAAAERERLKR